MVRCLFYCLASDKSRELSGCFVLSTRLDKAITFGVAATGGEDVSMLERKLMDTGDTKLHTRVSELAVGENGFAQEHQKGKAAEAAALSTPLPSELSIEKEFKSLEMSKIDLFSPDIQPVSPKVNVGSSALFPNAAPTVHPSPAPDAAPVHVARSVQQRVAGIPAPSTPPQLPGSRSRAGGAEEKSQDGKPGNVGDAPAAHVSRILTCSDATDVLDSIRSLRSHLQTSPRCTAVQDQVGTDSRLLPLIGRLLTIDSRRSQWTQDSSQQQDIDEQLLRLLYDVCKGHAVNVQRFCGNDSTLSAVLKISLDGVSNGTGKEAAVAAEILAFCIQHDDNWEKLAAARARLKKAHGAVKKGATTRTNASVSSATSNNGTHIRHSSNFLARQQAGIVHEWSA